MNKRIPTAVGLLILIAGLVAGVILVNSRTSFQSKAGPTESPKNIKISNRGAGGFSISWSTDIPMTGYIKYSEDVAKVNTPAGDVRDQISGTSQSYTNHYVNVSGLGANKTYYFLIGSGSQIYNDTGKPYQVRTLAATTSPAENVISGKIINTDSSPVNGAIVFVDIDGAETLSAITKNDGAWRLNLSTARMKDGKVLNVDPANTLLSIFVSAGTSGSATAITNTEKAKPVPDILMGKNQSFVDTEAVISDLTTGNENRGSGFALEESQPLGEIPTDTSGVVTFLNPAIEGELIATATPEFKVKLATGSGLVLKIGDLVSNGITKNEANEWVWSPESPLPSGLNTLKVEYLDATNKAQQVSRTFNVLSIGDVSGLPAFTATPSATPTVTVEITPEPTEAMTMPETQSENLSNTGTLEQSLAIAFSGLILLGLGSYLKKKWQ